MKVLNFFILSLFLCVVKINTASATPTYRCEIDVKSPWKAKYNTHVVLENVEISETSSALSQTLIYNSDEIDSKFSSSIYFLGNVIKDPLTQEKKLFIGVYNMWGINRQQPNSFTSIPFVTKGEPNLQWTEYAHPIVSAVSNSSAVEVFTGNFHNHKISFKCSETQVKPEVVYQPKRSSEDFTCNIKVKHKNTRHKIEEINKRITLGYSTTLRDLQPILEDEHLTRTFFGNVKLMGNLYYDSGSKTSKLIVGFYTVRKFYNPEQHNGYWIPPKNVKGPNDNPFYYANPESEGVTDTDYIEVRTDQAFSGIYDVFVGCKQIDSKTDYL